LINQKLKKENIRQR